jgi:hypothetical protein
MSKESLVEQFVTYHRFSDDQYYYLTNNDKKLSPEQAGALFNLCKKHMTEIEMDTPQRSTDLQTIRSAIRWRTEGGNFTTTNVGTDFTYP